MDRTPLPQLQAALGHGYRILRELGGGGMSRVFLARELNLGRDVVVKVLPPDLAAGIKIERFQREIHMVARLQHPHIVPILAAGSRHGLLYYTMPYVNGASLGERLKESAPIELIEAISILRDVADALSYAHSEGVIHRDVKPQNILLRSHHALVVDFGVAKALTVSAEESALTSTGLALGTPMYMAPEQATADPTVDERADIYSLGVVAYEVLAGRPPFSGASQQALMVAHVTAAPRPLLEVNAAVPAPLARVVMRCLEKDPKDRWQSAENLCEALDDMGARFTPTRRSAVPATVDDQEGAPVAPASQAGGANHRTAYSRFKARDLSKGQRWVLTGGMLVALLTVAGILAVQRRNAERAKLPSVAVMPFDNLDATKGTDYIADGVTRELGTTLGKIEGLKVASLTSSAAARRRDDDIRRIAAKLNVATVVEGSVRHAGTTIVVTAQLTNGGTGYQMWSGEFSDKTGNVLAVQARIARAIGTALVGRLIPRSGHQLGYSRAIDPKAEEYVLKGKFLEDDFDGEKLERAITFYKLALSIDSTYAPAHAAIANATYHLADDYLPPRQAYPVVKAAALKAIALDSTLAEAYASLAGYEISYGWNWSEAKRYLDRALSLNPQSSIALMLSGWYFLIIGDAAAAVEATMKASALDPFSDEIGGNVVSLLRAAGRHDLATAKIRQMLENDVGDQSQLLARLARESLAMGNAQLARAQVDSALQLQPDCCKRTRALLYAALGERESAREIVEALEAIRKKQYYRADFLAEARAALGDTTRVFAWLDQAYRDKSSSFPLFPHSTELRPFESDGRFASLKRRLRLPSVD